MIRDREHRCLRVGVRARGPPGSSGRGRSNPVPFTPLSPRTMALLTGSIDGRDVLQFPPWRYVAHSQFIS